eukprot:CAMPEP_0177655648 /NCGR_PEP_ID=MMETSP0447-20121125/15096_1 /TAXON_ID=0 /ORGANISM="Stygamoeba regulata, Strain BSH-02190019" /LENGTH=430 /DNA_ID=CAMNT_0019159615 /DNA_START=42 /DNA_END=1334 /DNA_ORIENTATION=-
MNIAKADGMADGPTTLQFQVVNQVGSLAEALNVLKNCELNMTSIRSLPSPLDPQKYQFYCSIDEKTPEHKIVPALKELEKLGYENCTIVGSKKAPWYPRRKKDLDLFVHKVLECGEELSSDHPGFSDQSYRERRTFICNLSRQYRHGDTIPRIEYLPEEIETWRTVYNKLTSLYPTHACKEHRFIFPLLEANCGYSPDNIPQLQDISNFLQETTGFTLRPVTGLLTPRDFLNGLAFRVFHSTQYIRHSSRPLYTPEPDVCHELLGHVPLFADQEFADFSQEIGLASLGASDEDIEKLASCYWFTVEFGLCKEGDGVKAFGAGLLSSFGELEYCLSDKPKLAPFDPVVASCTSYPITEYQPLYFVAHNFEDAKLKMKEFSRTLKRPFEVWFNPMTSTVETLDSMVSLRNLSSHVKTQSITLNSAIQKMTSQ